jgi:hypothetical protein
MKMSTKTRHHSAVDPEATMAQSKANLTALTTTFEILGKFDSESDSQKLLYAPLKIPLTYRETQCYRLDFEGDANAATAFVKQVLLDPISQEIQEGVGSAFPSAGFVLEYGMKGGALDLEKETILGYYRTQEKPGFDLTKLTLRKRIYVFGEGADPAPFIRDVCNPAIHTWEVVKAG